MVWDVTVAVTSWYGLERHSWRHLVWSGTSQLPSLGMIWDVTVAVTWYDLGRHSCRHLVYGLGPWDVTVAVTWYGLGRHSCRHLVWCGLGRHSHFHVVLSDITVAVALLRGLYVTDTTRHICLGWLHRTKRGVSLFEGQLYFHPLTFEVWWQCSICREPFRFSQRPFWSSL